MKNIFLYLLVSFTLSSCVKFKTADLVVHNARIYTVNQEFEIAQAMAINNGKIIAIGKEHEIMNKYRADKLLDAETRPIYPGFMDGHCHFLGAGLNSLAVDLSEVKTLENLQNRIERHRNSNPDSKWLVGFGWDENKWNFTTKEAYAAINEKFVDKAVLLWRVDGHSLLVNYKAQIDAKYYSFDQNSGIITEEVIPLFTKAISYTDAQKKAGLRFSEENYFSKGVTTVSDAGLTPSEVRLIENMQESGTLEMNVNAMLYFSKEASRILPIAKEKLMANTYKVVLDGSVGSQSACFKKPYKGTNNYGKILMTRDSLRLIAQIAYDQGAQLAVHCIGDSALDMALEVMGKVLKGTNGLGWRIEHAQTVTESQLELFKKYAIIPSVQPTHLNDDKEMVEKNLTEVQLKNSYRLSTLMEQNQMIALGTDFPVATNNPIHTFYHAVYRSNKPWVLQSENMSREEALRGITFWVALANKTYEQNGSLEIGKSADFVILDRDIMKIPKDELQSAEVLKTFVSGGLVFEKIN